MGIHPTHASSSGGNPPENPPGGVTTEQWPISDQGTNLVHEGLREGGFVDLVVPIAAVAHDVHDHITFPALPPLARQLARASHRLHVIAVDMQDRRVEGLGHVRAVGGGSRLARIRRERHLCDSGAGYKFPSTE